jgi:hypothetical protein
LSPGGADNVLWKADVVGLVDVRDYATAVHSLVGSIIGKKRWVIDTEEGVESGIEVGDGATPTDNTCDLVMQPVDRQLIHSVTKNVDFNNVIVHQVDGGSWHEETLAGLAPR